MTTSARAGTPWGLVIGVGILAILLAVVGLGWLMDPLRVFDVRDVTWAGVVASAVDGRLDDGRAVPRGGGRPSPAYQDGDLLIGGGTVDDPTWEVALRPRVEEPACYQSRAIGYEDGPAVVLIHDEGGPRFGIRVAKAAGFTDDDAPDGQYLGTRGRDALVASIAARPWLTARISYFCLDRDGHATRWDRGY